MKLAELKHWEASLEHIARSEGQKVHFPQQGIEPVSASMRALLQLRHHDDLSTKETTRKQNRTPERVRVSPFRDRQQRKQCIEGTLAQEAP